MKKRNKLKQPLRVSKSGQFRKEYGCIELSHAMIMDAVSAITGKPVDELIVTNDNIYCCFDKSVGDITMSDVKNIKTALKLSA